MDATRPSHPLQELEARFSATGKREYLHFQPRSLTAIPPSSCKVVIKHNAVHTLCVHISYMPWCSIIGVTTSGKYFTLYYVWTLFLSIRKKMTTFLTRYPESSQRRARTSFRFPQAVLYSPCAVLMETKHVVWQAHSFVLPTSVSCSSLSVYRHCPKMHRLFFPEEFH